MNETERQWLEEMAEAERGIPLIAGAGSPRGELPGQLGLPVSRVPLWMIALMCGVLVLSLDYSLRMLAEAVLTPVWANHWLTSAVNHALACLAAPLAFLIVLKFASHRPHHFLSSSSKVE